MVDGNNFGLNGSYEYTEYELDSFDCVNANNGNESITNWPKFFLGKPLDNVAAVKIIEATIPFKYYVINETNNTFGFEEFIGAVWNDEGPVTLGVGTYDSASMVTELATVLTAASPLNNYTVTFDSVTCKFTITNDMGVAGEKFRLQFGEVGDQGKTNPRLVLGFPAYYTQSTTFSPTCTLLAPNVAELEGPPYLYLNSRSLGALVPLFLPGNGIVNPPNGGADGPQIAKIPVNADPGKLIHYSDPDPQKWFGLNNTNLSGNLDLYLTLGTADNIQILDLNGARFSVKLGILQASLEHTEALKSGRGTKRAVSRTWPTSGVMQF